MTLGDLAWNHQEAGGQRGQRQAVVAVSFPTPLGACYLCASSLRCQFWCRKLVFDSTYETWQGEDLPVTTTAQMLNTFVYMSSDFSKSTSREPKCPGWLNLFCLKSAGEGGVGLLARVRSWYSFKTLKFNNINYFFLMILCEREHGERQMLALTSGRNING